MIRLFWLRALLAAVGNRWRFFGDEGRVFCQLIVILMVNHWVLISAS